MAFRGDRLVFAIFANSVGDAVEQMRTGYGAGARAVLVAPPSYFKGVSEEGIAGWYQQVIRQLGDEARDILLYNIPSLTGVALSVDLVGRLRQSLGRSIAGVKDSSCDWNVTDPLVRAHNDIHILVGDERDLAAAVRLGGAGCISGMANVFPHAVAGLVRGQDDPFLAGGCRRDQPLRHPPGDQDAGRRRDREAGLGDGAAATGAAERGRRGATRRGGGSPAAEPGGVGGVGRRADPWNSFDRRPTPRLPST